MPPASIVATVRLRLRSLLRRKSVEDRFAEEIRLHLDLETERNLRAGMSNAEARRAALIAFGGIERVREEHRDARGVRIIEDLVTDLHYAARWLRRSPAFTVSAMATFALGIGGATAMFSVVHGVLLKPLPYPDPDALVAIWSRFSSETEPSTSSPPDFRELRARARAFTTVEAYYGTPTNLVIGTEPHRAFGARVSTGLLSTLGARFAAGRGFSDSEGVAGNDRVAIIGHGLWRTSFGGRSDIVGSSITIDGHPHRIVGVVDAEFRFLDPTVELWRPLAFAADDNLNTRGNYFLRVIGRLRPETSVAAAEADLNRVASEVRQQVPQAAITGAFVVPLHEQMVGSARQALLLLLGATGLLLAIACANVAGLLLARSSAREQEIAVRAGLGASRARLMRQLVAESLLLGTCGAAVGLLVAGLLLDLLKSADIGVVPRLADARIDAVVFAAAVVASMLAAIVVGLWPAARLTRRSPNALRSGVRSSSSREHQRARRLLVAGQVALAVVLLIGSGLLLRSFTAMMRLDPGFTVTNLVTASLPVGARYDDEERLWPFADQVLARLSGRAGIESVALTSALSLRADSWNKVVTLGDRPLPTTRDQLPVVGYRLVSRDYFSTLGVRRLSGRVFGTQDGAHSQRVAVVNETFARRYWPAGIAEPLGKIIWMGPPEELIQSMLRPGFRFPRLTIIGVVADERFEALDVPPQPEVYQLYAQSTETPSSIYIAARSSTVAAAVASMRAAVREVDPSMPVAEVATARELVRASAAPRRLAALLVSSFAALALFLAGVGIYGVASQFVAQRTREMGIRMAIGARGHQVIALVLREGMLTAAGGIVVGIGAAFASARLLRDVLFGVAPTDLMTYGVMALVLAAVVLAATGIPARRAARTPPADVLRAE